MLYLVDGSHHNAGTFDWAKAKANGLAGIIWKVTEGNSFTDSTWKAKTIAAKSAGLVIGAYHFLHASAQVPILSQVDYFLNKIGGSAEGLLVMIDTESETGFPAPTLADLKNWVNIFTTKTDGHPVLIYLSTGFANGQHWAGDLHSLGPWIRPHYIPHSGVNDYRNIAALVPASYWGSGFLGWTKPKMLQYTNSGVVPGISNVIDCNLFDGTIDELKALTTSRKGDPLSTPEAITILNQILAAVQDLQNDNRMFWENAAAPIHYTVDPTGIDPFSGDVSVRQVLATTSRLVQGIANTEAQEVTTPALVKIAADKGSEPDSLPT